jgi:hypothetical protein
MQIRLFDIGYRGPTGSLADMRLNTGTGTKNKIYSTGILRHDRKLYNQVAVQITGICLLPVPYRYLTNTNSEINSPKMTAI